MNGDGIKPWEELTIQDDYIFKRVMRHKRLCRKFLEKILRIRIRAIRYLENEKSMKAAYGSKGIRLDVYVADEKDTVYNIEMQVKRPEGDGLYKRTRYYQAMIDLDLLAAGADYDSLHPVIIIFICPFALFDGKRHLYTFRNFCAEDRTLELGDETTKLFLSTRGETDDVPPDVKAFLDYVDGIPSEDAFVQEIETTIRKLKMMESERVSYMTLEMKMKEERKEGIKEGIKEGMRQTLLDNVRSLMKTMNLSAEEAMKALALSPEQQKEIAPLL